MKHKTFKQLTGHEPSEVLDQILFDYEYMVEEDSIGEMLTMLELAEYPIDREQAYREHEEDPGESNAYIRKAFKEFYKSQLNLRMLELIEDMKKRMDE